VTGCLRGTVLFLSKEYDSPLDPLILGLY
jgi:hypothetical protein